MNWLDKILTFDLGIALGSVASTSLGTSQGLDYCPRGSAFTPADEDAGNKHEWWRADSADITFNATRISAWNGKWNGEDLIQVTGANQPLWDATGLLGMPCSVNDDGPRKIAVTLASAIPLGSRIYIMIIAQVTTNANGLYLFSACDAGGANVLLSHQDTATNWNAWRQEGPGGGQFELINAIAHDTSPHRFELGYTAGGTAARVIDGTANNTAISGTGVANMTQIRLHQRYDASSGLRSKIAEVVALKNEPTAGRKAEYRTYFAGYYPGLA